MSEPAIECTCEMGEMGTVECLTPGCPLHDQPERARASLSVRNDLREQIMAVPIPPYFDDRLTIADVIRQDRERVLAAVAERERALRALDAGANAKRYDDGYDDGREAAVREHDLSASIGEWIITTSQEAPGRRICTGWVIDGREVLVGIFGYAKQEPKDRRWWSR